MTEMPALQKIDHVGRDADARIVDELEGLFEDALDQRFVEKLKFGSHSVSPACWLLFYIVPAVLNRLDGLLQLLLH
jgi:hypothetical protein